MRSQSARRQWTPENTAELVRLYPNTPTAELACQLGETPRRIYAKACHLSLRKTDEYLASDAAHRIRCNSPRGVSSQFIKGMIPWNKGKKGLNLGGKATQFKPGHLGGNALKNRKPIGATRVSDEGYLEIKLNDDRPFRSRWRAVHLVEWEKINGRIPDGHALTFRDGNRQNIALENLELITRAELMRRNSYHRYGKEIARVIQLRGAIKRQLNRRSKNV